MNKNEIALAFARHAGGKCHNAWTDGQTYWLHQTPIAVWKDRTVQFYWGGYYTPTTASNMNKILAALGASFRVGYASARDRQDTHFVLEFDRMFEEVV